MTRLANALDAAGWLAFAGLGLAVIVEAARHPAKALIAAAACWALSAVLRLAVRRRDRRAG